MPKLTLRRKPKAEPATLKVSERAAAIIAAKDAEITDLRDELEDREETIAGHRESLQYRAEEGAALSRRAERAEAERATLQAKIAEYAGEWERTERAERQIEGAIAALRPLARRSGMTIAERADAAAGLLASLELPGGTDALARAALEDAAPDPQSPESQASIDRMMVARSKTRRRP